MSQIRKYLSDFPHLVAEWHVTKNAGLEPSKITYASGRKVWWKCDKGDDHEWISAINDRKQGNACPYCTLTPQSKQELTITFELIQYAPYFELFSQL